MYMFACTLSSALCRMRASFQRYSGDVPLKAEGVDIRVDVCIIGISINKVFPRTQFTGECYVQFDYGL